DRRELHSFNYTPSGSTEWGREPGLEWTVLGDFVSGPDPHATAPSPLPEAQEMRPTWAASRQYRRPVAESRTMENAEGSGKPVLLFVLLFVATAGRILKE